MALPRRDVPAPRSGSDVLFEGRRSLEADSLARLDSDRLASAGIEPFARPGLADGEGSEARQLELASFFKFPDDRRHQFASGTVRRHTGEIG